MNAPFKLTHPRRSKGNPETPIVKAIIETLNVLAGVECWRTNSGAILNQRGIPVRMNPDGCGDVSGVVAPWGLHFEVEAKRPGKKQRETQIARQKMLMKRGAIYILAHDGPEARQALNAAIETWASRWTIDRNLYPSWTFNR